MTAVFTAVYSGGKFHPTTPPDLPDGATVRLTVEADAPDSTAPPDTPTPYEILAAISRRSAKPGPFDDASVNHDKYLYGETGAPGHVR